MARRKKSSKHSPSDGNRRKQRLSGKTGDDQPSPDNRWLYGHHPVVAALNNPNRRPIRLVTTENGADALAHLKAPIVREMEIVGREDIEALLPPRAVHQGMALLAEPLLRTDIVDLVDLAKADKQLLVVALDQVTDPQNIGAVMRSAAAFGAKAILVPDRNTPETTGALAKAASGATEIVPLVRVQNLVRALEELKKVGFWIAGLTADAPNEISATDLPDICVLVLGAEGKGMRRLTDETCDLKLRVPISDAMESLNVSSTAAIVMYEWFRQKTLP